MNKIRRNELGNILERLDALMCDLETIKDNEQEAYDNLPESLQSSDRGDLMCENIDDLESAYDNLQDVCDKINDIVYR